jgi:transcriptional regulator GlxA family with amidase domain
VRTPDPAVWSSRTLDHGACAQGGPGARAVGRGRRNRHCCVHGGAAAQASGNPHGLGRSNLFTLIDVYLLRNLAAAVSPVALALQFGISERTFHRIFADRGTTFERHALRRRVERFRDLLMESRLRDSSIAKLALECGFADAAHASRTFKQAFGATPRDYRSGAALRGHGLGRTPALR